MDRFEGNKATRQHEYRAILIIHDTLFLLTEGREAPPTIDILASFMDVGVSNSLIQGVERFAKETLYVEKL